MRLNVKEYDVDDVLIEVGQLGQYQTKLYAYFNIQHIIIAIVALSIVFVGAEPSWTCITAKDAVARSIGFSEIKEEDTLGSQKERCALYEERRCSVEVDKPGTSIVAEVRSKEVIMISLLCIV